MSAETEAPREASYGQILESSSIIGGAQAINYLISLVRIKIVAVLLGPTGVGLIGLYQSLTSLLSTVSGLGINSSGVREVANAHGHNDPAAYARTVKTLLRACWVTGLAGWAVTALLAEQISHWVFGSIEHELEIALLGSTLLLTSVSGGYMALIQGMRRIGDLARMNVTAMLINTVVAIGGYAWLGISGIIPVLLANAAVTLLVSWYYSRRIDTPPVDLSWSETLSGGKALAYLGVAFMWGGLLTMGVDLVARSMITREYGIDAAGYYQAAWALSGIFAGFVLGAMSADYYPRLTSVIENRLEAAHLINEQIEVGTLLALPGLLATLAFSPFVIRLLYTGDFIVAATLLPWFMLGVFGRVVSWPCGFVQLALGKAHWFFATQTIFAALHLALLLWFVPAFGIVGAAYAFAILYFVHAPIIALVARYLIGFRWSAAARRLLAVAALVVAAAVASSLALSGWTSLAIGAGITIIGTIISLRGLSERLGPKHRFILLCRRIPGAVWVMDAGRG